MTTLTAYYHLDLDNASIWDGEVTVKGATHIQIKDSTHEQNYYGSFTFDTSGYLVKGTIASTDYSEDESGSWVKKYDISGGKYNALTVFKNHHLFYLNFNVPIASNTHSIVMIQNLITIFGSSQP